MTIITTRFGNELKLPSTFQIKHQLLFFWLKNQLAKEAAEDDAAARVVSATRPALSLLAGAMAHWTDAKISDGFHTQMAPSVRMEARPL